jgi:hypothetical protein
VGSDTERPSPNPNVLVELGYALRALGEERVILVMNTAFGKPEALPFDLRRKRITPYALTEASEDKPRQREVLVKTLEAGLRLILAKLAAPAAAPDPVANATNAITNRGSDQGSATRDAMRLLTDQIEALQPVPQRPTIADEVLMETLPKTVPIVAKFARLVDIAARHDSKEALLAAAKGIEPVLRGYYVSTRGGLSVVDNERGLSQVLGHELIVTLVAALIRHERWDRLQEFLAKTYVVELNQGPKTLGWAWFSSTVGTLLARQRRLNLRTAILHADLLRDRHSTGDLGPTAPFRDFLEADVFLFLATELVPEQAPTQGGSSSSWTPWSAIHIERFHSLTFLHEVEAVARCIGFTNAHEFRRRYTERADRGLRKALQGLAPFFDPKLPLPEPIGGS